MNQHRNKRNLNFGLIAGVKICKNNYRQYILTNEIKLLKDVVHWTSISYVVGFKHATVDAKCQKTIILPT
ncbi:hypothetical protein C5167_049001 [Papaver somniferum]|uniref:Uncharacterized protein n=1 Tax=Papaver somniferum TaxID=3469 RepID=A0A4Y7KMA2_PAPSO|nr:hypothetical protein C5167_049001 [Papaver somniferum]